MLLIFNSSPILFSPTSNILSKTSCFFVLQDENRQEKIEVYKYNNNYVQIPTLNLFYFYLSSFLFRLKILSF